MRAFLKLLLLCSTEMIKPQGDGTGAILNLAGQTTTPPKGNTRGLHYAFNNRVHTGAQSTNGADLRAILITQGQMKQHVLHAVNIERGQFLGELCAHPF